MYHWSVYFACWLKTTLSLLPSQTEQKLRWNEQLVHPIINMHACVFVIYQGAPCSKVTGHTCSASPCVGKTPLTSFVLHQFVIKGFVVCAAAVQLCIRLWKGAESLAISSRWSFGPTWALRVLLLPQCRWQPSEWQRGLAYAGLLTGLKRGVAKELNTPYSHCCLFKTWNHAPLTTIARPCEGDYYSGVQIDVHTDHPLLNSMIHVCLFVCLLFSFEFSCSKGSEPQGLWFRLQNKVNKYI